MNRNDSHVQEYIVESCIKPLTAYSISEAIDEALPEGV